MTQDGESEPATPHPAKRVKQMEKNEKKTWVVREAAVLLILMIFSIIVFLASLKILLTNPGGNSPGIFPVLASGGMIITCLAAILQIRTNRPQPEEEEKMPGGWSGFKISIGTEVPFPVFVMMIATILYAVAMTYVGFYISTAIYMCFSIVFLYHGKHIRRAIFVSIGFLAAVYVIIDLIFKVHMP